MLSEPESVLALADAAGLLQQGFSLSSAPFWFWWLVPVVGTILVASVLRMSRREYRPRGSFKSVADFDRFRETMHERRTPRQADKRE